VKDRKTEDRDFFRIRLTPKRAGNLRFSEALFKIDDPVIEQAIVVILEGLARSRGAHNTKPPTRSGRRKIPKRTKAS